MDSSPSGDDPIRIPISRRSKTLRNTPKPWGHSLRGPACTLPAIFLVAVLGLAQSARAPQSPQPPASTLTLPHPVAGWRFPQRETLTYAIDWRVFPAGTATVHLEQDGPLERIVVSGDSQGAINLLFRVSDRFQSAFNRATGCSQSFTRQIMEGHRQVTSDQRIDGTHTSYSERNLVSHIERHLTATIPPCVTDMLSGIYYTSSQPLDPGTVLHLPVVSGDHVSNVTLHVEARETIRTPTTTYHTIRVQPTADSGAIQNRGKLWVWYSDDQQHIPVQMRARLFWGTITFRLTGIDTK